MARKIVRLRKNRRVSLKITGLAAALAGLSLLASACTPITANRGNLLTDAKLTEIRPALSSRYDVTKAFGPPTAVAPFDPNLWYYIGERTEQIGIYKTEVTERRIVAVQFDGTGLVTELREVDAGQGQEIEPVDRRTPTAGREFTFLQQLVGNLGRFEKGGDTKNSESNNR